MAYDVDARKHEHQVKVRLDNQDFIDWRSMAQSMKFQHSVLGRAAFKWLIEYHKQHGHLPPELERDIESRLEQKRA
jgi:hypothetical protein